MTVAERLSQLGIALPEVPAPAGSYAAAVRVGSLVLTSGQLPFSEGRLEYTGVVGSGSGQVTAAQATAAARTATINALAAIQVLLGCLDFVTQVVKVTVFVASAPDFTGQAGVANGASDLLGDVFGRAGIHARAAVGVAVLPLGSPVEVEVMVAVGE